jgi:hypothetical protein
MFAAEDAAAAMVEVSTTKRRNGASVAATHGSRARVADLLEPRVPATVERLPVYTGAREIALQLASNGFDVSQSSAAGTHLPSLAEPNPVVTNQL